MSTPDFTEPLTDREKLIMELAITATIRMINQGGPDAWRDYSIDEIRSDARAEITQLLAESGTGKS
jgi:hypothetical protein